ncbi:MAG: aminopeptidase N [Pseudobdellovibrionaceae bacterium]
MKKTFLKDYTAPTHQVSSVFLSFDIGPEFTTVTQVSQMVQSGSSNSLSLDGESLVLKELVVNDLHPNYRKNDQGIELTDLPKEFKLKVVTVLEPKKNTSLEGLYTSGSGFVTQCEAQGFRRITYFQDRPDVMTKYTVEITADASLCPVILSNGNKISEKIENSRKTVVWSDPFAKPCYLFALFAGDLGVLKDTFTTQSGRQVQLEIYSAHGTQNRCLHAMESLKKSMKWDEERFGREYDLDIYMVVAIDDFNAGAMENKGLNIFNSRLVLADPKTATDNEYFAIESVVAHEYFHNWTGNRVTLRDWFHLSLKEGLTVFRDQEFSQDVTGSPTIRIDTVGDLRDSQFAEDAGPNAHPIRPSSCYAVDNFFTSTIYEKGSEVIRMMQTMVGKPGFRKGMDLYFQRHDGQAVIIEDFAGAIAEANQQDWSQFKLWYSQAGTPTVTAKEHYDSARQELSLTLTQSCPLTQKEKEEGLTKKPFHIPLMVGLVDLQTGEDVAIRCESAQKNSDGNYLLHLKQEQETFIFKHLEAKPLVSLNRQFSAPIHLHHEKSQPELIHQLRKDSDAFNRWEASQVLLSQVLQKNIDRALKKEALETPSELLEVYATVLANEQLDPGLKAALISLPSESYLLQLRDNLDGAAFLAARLHLEKALAETCKEELLKIYLKYHGKNTTSTASSEFGKRKLKNICLSYLAHLQQTEALVMSQFEQAQMMTDESAAFSILLDMSEAYRKRGIEVFFDRWKSESLVLNKWYAFIANSSHPSTFEQVKALWASPEFNRKNPNRVYSLLWRFGDNFAAFHGGSLETYRFLAECILELDQMNPQVATRIAGSFDPWRKLVAARKQKAQEALDFLLSQKLSPNTFEVVSNARGK